MATPYQEYLTSTVIDTVVKSVRFAHKNGLRTLLQHVNRAISNQRMGTVAPLDMTVTAGGATVAEVQAIADKVDDLISKAILGGVMVPPPPPEE